METRMIKSPIELTPADEADRRLLVNSEGTRAVREWDDLLSVFEGEKVRRLEG